MLSKIISRQAEQLRQTANAIFGRDTGARKPSFRSEIQELQESTERLRKQIAQIEASNRQWQEEKEKARQQSQELHISFKLPENLRWHVEGEKDDKEISIVSSMYPNDIQGEAWIKSKTLTDSSGGQTTIFEIAGLYVTKEARGQGLSLKLLDAAIYLGGEQLWVHHENKAAVRTYRKRMMISNVENGRLLMCLPGSQAHQLQQGRNLAPVWKTEEDLPRELQLRAMISNEAWCYQDQPRTFLPPISQEMLAGLYKTTSD